MPSFRSSTTAALRQRIVSGENGSMNGIPFAFRSGFAVAQDAVVTRRRLDREAGRFEPAEVGPGPRSPLRGYEGRQRRPLAEQQRGEQEHCDERTCQRQRGEAAEGDD